MSEMSETSTAIPRDFKNLSSPDVGSHCGYIFESSSDKQSKLFELCREFVSRNSSVLYIAGKQGVKGIRLSLIDTGFDVASYQRIGKMSIVDSEEWFLAGSRRTQFKSFVNLEEEFRGASVNAIERGHEFLVVVSETDMLVRK